MPESGHKLAKKARQVFRKNESKFFAEAIKPKPKWVPWKVYRFLLGLVLKIDK